MNRKKTISRIAFALVSMALVLAALLYWYVKKQGPAAIAWDNYTVAKVVFDRHGIATVESSDWEKLIEGQGFATASERLWQMDLMRRTAAGRLSEWFGERAARVDERRHQEGWQSVADAAVEKLPSEERTYCEAYARGVNDFIARARSFWGIEYRLLGQTPEPWLCRDSIFVLMLMGEDLSEAVPDEIAQWTWRRHLPSEWQALLFAQNHPWNVPIFGEAKRSLSLPKPLPRKAVAAEELDRLRTAEPFVPGSNSWSWSSPAAAFVANDPHLGRNVPQLWYAIRLKKDGKHWAVGATIPGLPGIVLGRNRQIAWAFTNAKEDVDDLLAETLSEDGKKYLATRSQGKEEWRPLEERPYTIRVKDSAPKTGVARFTHRGPLLRFPELGGGVFSRQWLVLRPEMLRLPTVELAQAENWEQFNHAFDSMHVPAQSVLFMDRLGRGGIRIAGTGVVRRKSGLVPSDALLGEWVAIEPPSKRPRRAPQVPTPERPFFLASANERLWEDSYGHHWSTDQRRERIDRMLRENPQMTRRSMELMQEDTSSRYHQLLAKWIHKNLAIKTSAIADRLANWNGQATSDPALLTQLLSADRAWVSLVLERVQASFIPSEEKALPYRWKLENAWQVKVLESPDSVAVFGIDPRELAEALVVRIEKGLAEGQDYRHVNRSQSQHPLAGVKSIGWLFRIPEPDQVGWGSFVRVEKPKFGASTRLVWDLRARDGGTWIFPVGQSGHIGSKHYLDMQSLWFSGVRLSVLEGEGWNNQAD